jgi:hypothetical protein
MSKIMVLKLASGEELLGEVTATETTVNMRHPLAVMTKMDPQTGSLSVGFVPYAPICADKTITIYPHAIVLDYEPDQQMVNQWNEKYGSGIVIAGANELPKA